MVQSEIHVSLSAASSRISSSAIREILSLTERPEIISLAGGLPAPEAFPAVEIAEEIARLLADDPAGVLQYARSEGYGPLCDWVAGAQGVGDGHVVITHGSQQALDLVARATVDPGATIALADPGYVGAVQALRLAGAHLAGIPNDGDGLRVDILQDRLAAGLRPALVYVVADFDNPTGATLSLERRLALARLADRYGFLVVEDNPYGRLRWTGAPLPAIASLSDRVVSLGTTSKILAPGLRLGWVIGPRPLAARILLLKQAVDLHTAPLAQRVGLALLTRPGFLPRHLARIRGLYQSRSVALSTALREQLGDQLEFHAPDGGMFVWVRLRDDGVDTEALLPMALAEGVAFVPGSAFSVHDRHEDALRLSFATASPDELTEGVRRLGRALAAAGPGPVGGNRR